MDTPILKDIHLKSRKGDEETGNKGSEMIWFDTAIFRDWFIRSVVYFSTRS